MKNALLLLVTLLLLTQPLSSNAAQAQYPLLKRADLPLYPALLKTAHVSGVVQVQVTVKAGVVVQAKPISGDRLLVSAASENIKTWEFDQAVSATFTTTFIYELEKQETPTPLNPRLELELPRMAKIIARPPVPISQY